MPMRVLLFEPLFGGHHLHYVRVLTEGLLELGVEVTWALDPDAREASDYGVHLKELEAKVERVNVPQRLEGAGFQSWRRVAGGLLRATGDARPDRVILPYAGGLAAGLGSRPRPWPFPGIPLEGLVMRGGWAYPLPSRSARAKADLNLRLMSRVPWDRLHLLDPLTLYGLEGAGFRRPERCRLVPEPVEPIESVELAEARRRLGLDADGQWLVVTGMQDRRKGSDRLLEAFRDADLPAEARLLLAGRQSEDLRRWIAGPGRPLVEAGRLSVIDRYLTAEEHDLALNAADCMAAPHVRPVGSSGLLVRAAALRKPVLATDYGWVGWATRTFGLGRTVDVEDPTAYAAAVAELFRDPPAFGNDLTEGFLRFHTLANQRHHLLERTRRSLGVESEDGFAPWPRVPHPA